VGLSEHAKGAFAQRDGARQPRACVAPPHTMFSISGGVMKPLSRRERAR
jgi:hypothetical protein